MQLETCLVIDTHVLTEDPNGRGRTCHAKPGEEPVSDKNQTGDDTNIKNIIIITVAVVVAWFIIITIVIL